jgi:hypothetical protein
MGVYVTKFRCSGAGCTLNGMLTTLARNRARVNRLGWVDILPEKFGRSCHDRFKSLLRWP